MLRTLILSLLVTTSTTACDRAVVSNQPQISPEVENIVFSTESISLSNLTLLAREEKSLPPGTTPDPNRDIGFASVFLRLENKKEENVHIMVKNIEIRNTADGRVQLASSSLQKIILRPLENSELVFHLNNKTGYSRHNQVKAVITVQIGDRVKVIESIPVKIERL